MRPGASESCDGLDSDCSGTIGSDDDEDGIPDQQPEGTVSSAEVGGALDCETFDPDAAQSFSAEGLCSGPVLGSDDIDTHSPVGCGVVGALCADLCGDLTAA